MKKWYNPEEYSVEQMKYKLSVLRKFQLEHPLSHVGGSVGLYLHGVDLKRDISRTDLDLTIPDFIDELDHKEEFDKCPSDASDFDYRTMSRTKDNYFCCKMEIRVSPEPSFTVIEFQGFKYNVSLLSNILFWKKKYARKGVQKHVDDLITIETGVRPPRKVDMQLIRELKNLDLPF